MTRDELSSVRRLEGCRISIALSDGSRLDDCHLVSVARHGVSNLWLYANGGDTFVAVDDVLDVWEAQPACA